MKKKVKVDIIDHYEEKTVSSVQRIPIYRKVEKEIDTCDICGKAFRDIPICLGCGKTVCHLCDRNDEHLEMIQLWVGTQQERGDNYFVEQSDDFDTEYFYICKECKENPPEKIKFWEKQKEIERLEDEIKRVTKEMIMGARQVKNEQ